MPRDYKTISPNRVTRKDRAVDDDAWIKAALRRAPMGYLATLHGEQPFINSNLYVYDEQAHVIYMHTAKVGRTRAAVESAERVCFTVTSMGRLLPAPEALEFSVEYSGVVVFGTAQIITSDAEAMHALQILLDKYAPHLKAGEDYRPPTQSEINRTTVYKIAIESWSGKKKEVASDFPGAYRYEEVLARS